MFCWCDVCIPSKKIPDRTVSDKRRLESFHAIHHFGDDGYRIYLEIFGGGYGASAHADGCDAVDSPLSNCGNIPAESMDLDYEFFRVLEYSMRAESVGAGRHRGGMGFCRRYLITRGNVTPGIFGGQPGARAASHVLRKGRRITIGSKQSFALEKDDVLVMLTGGGAGYGDPLERAHHLIESDLDQGLIRPATARRVYGLARRS